jgi:hypothetical protein
VLAGPSDFQFSPDSQRLFYLADQETDNITELFAAFEAPTVEFTQPGYVVAEDGSLATTLAVRRVGLAAAPGSVRVQLTGQPEGGTATGGASLAAPGVDFVDNARDVNFTAGQVTATLNIPIKNDGVAEAAESFSMLLFEPNQVVTGTQDAAEVVILDNGNAPLLDDATLALPENSANGTPLPPQLKSSALEITAATTYTILAGNTGNAFRIDSSGQLLVNNSAALNYESTPTFVLLVEARADGGSFDVATWAINLEDQNEPPLFAAQTRSVAENSPINSTVGAKLVATDPDGDPLTFSLTSDIFNITSAGQLLIRNSNALDFETRPQHLLTVTVADGKGLQRAATVTVNILDLAEGDATAPAIVSLSPSSVVAGGKDFTLVVKGDNLTTNSVVRWNGSNRKTILSKGALVASITAQDIAAATTAKVDVIDGLTKKVSNVVAFSVVKAQVGIAELTIAPEGGGQQSRAGQPTLFTLTWTHTTQPWRTMDEMDLRLVAGEQSGLWVRYQGRQRCTGKRHKHADSAQPRRHGGRQRGLQRSQGAGERDGAFGPGPGQHHRHWRARAHAYGAHPGYLQSRRGER